jgi:hypothetical protein
MPAPFLRRMVKRRLAASSTWTGTLSKGERGLGRRWRIRPDSRQMVCWAYEVSWR